MKNLIKKIYDVADTARYLFLGDRSPLTRPLFLVDKPLRAFMEKYGQNFGHFNFKSLDPISQIKFLEDYRGYLKYTNKNIETCVIDEKKIKMHITNKKQDRYTLLFSDKGIPCFIYASDSSGSGYGSLSLSFEINL